MESDAELEETLRKAITLHEPVLVEVPTSRDAAGPWVPGWWDFPIPAYVEAGQEEYHAYRSNEQHL